MIDFQKNTITKPNINMLNIKKMVELCVVSKRYENVRNDIILAKRHLYKLIDSDFSHKIEKVGRAFPWVVEFSNGVKLDVYNPTSDFLSHPYSMINTGANADLIMLKRITHSDNEEYNNLVNKFNEEIICL